MNKQQPRKTPENINLQKNLHSLYTPILERKKKNTIYT